MRYFFNFHLLRSQRDISTLMKAYRSVRRYFEVIYGEFECFYCKAWAGLTFGPSFSLSGLFLVFKRWVFGFARPRGGGV